MPSLTGWGEGADFAGTAQLRATGIFSCCDIVVVLKQPHPLESHLGKCVIADVSLIRIKATGVQKCTVFADANTYST